MYMIINIYSNTFTSSGGCIGLYLTGRKLCKFPDSPRSQEYGRIAKHYGKFCGAIVWAHVLVAAGGGLYYAKTLNLPRAGYLQRGRICVSHFLYSFFKKYMQRGRIFVSHFLYSCFSKCMQSLQIFNECSQVTIFFT